MDRVPESRLQVARIVIKRILILEGIDNNKFYIKMWYNLDIKCLFIFYKYICKN